MTRIESLTALGGIAAIAALAACDRASPPRGAGGQDAPATASTVGFSLREASEAAGIRFRHWDGSSGRYSIVETLASGVGLLDYDADGDLDIYFLNGRVLFPDDPVPSAATPRNALYRNDGGLRFSDVTDEAGVPGVGFSVGCAAGDYDGDGDLDLYVAGFGSNVLYRNEGNGKFSDRTQEASVDDHRLSAGAAFLDYDRDGDLDLYVSNYCEPALATSRPCETNGVPGYCAPGQYTPVHDSFFRNRGDGTFEDVSDAVGIRPAAKWGMGVIALDYDDDGWIDIYVANDVSDNFLFRNLGDGRFENVALNLGVALGTDGVEQGSMGVDAGDFDRDGRFDIIVTNYQKQLNALYRQEGKFGFSDVSVIQLGNTCYPNVAWGTGFVDLDCDAWPELFVANGHLEDRIGEYDQSSTFLQENQVYVNERGRFREVTNAAGPALTEKKSSRGAAFGDIDNDGDIDIVVCNSRDRPSLYINGGGGPNGAPQDAWVLLDLRGRKNRFAIGARVVLEAGGLRQIGEVRSGGSYVSQNDLRLHFGLGAAERVDRVTIRWPEGKTSTLEGLEARRIHRIEEP
jgi:hypothetical protein